jgi:hypothetical protein
MEAGQLLAEALTKYANRNDVIVLTLPCGGMPVAFEVANKLSAALDVFVVRKFRNPSLRPPVRPDPTDSLEKRKPLSFHFDNKRTPHETT